MRELDFVRLSLVWLSLIRVLLSYLLGIEAFLLLWWSILVVVTISFLMIKLFLFYLLFELRLVPILIIIIYHGTQPERLRARTAFLIYTLFISIPYLIFIILMLPNHSFILIKRQEPRMIIILLLLLPFLVKIPILGLHFWLPKAHVEASTSGSIVLAGLLLKLGSYGVIRVFYLFRRLVIIPWRGLFWLILSLIRRFLTIIQTDVKKLVAYSRVTHITFMILGITTNSKFIILRVVILSLAHGWASMGIFEGAGSISHRSSSRLNYFLTSEYSLNWFVIIMGALLVRNARVPPLPSFYPEVGILISLVGMYSFNWIVLFILLSLIVCYYNTFLYFLISNTIKNVRRTLYTSLSKEGGSLYLLFLISLLTLGWLQLLFKPNT